MKVTFNEKAFEECLVWQHEDRKTRIDDTI